MILGISAYLAACAVVIYEWSSIKNWNKFLRNTVRVTVLPGVLLILALVGALTGVLCMLVLFINYKTGRESIFNSMDWLSDNWPVFVEEYKDYKKAE